jgi:hypothetical protein
MAASASASRVKSPCARLAGRAQRRPVDGGADVGEVEMCVCRRGRAARHRLVHAELDRAEAVLHDGVGRDLAAPDRERPERLLQRLERYARIDERAEDHVAGRAGETVEVEDLHGAVN